jgi:glycerophosphoryl diester phosphodiesterase
MGKTEIFAHRGANREAAENTRAAFDHALNYAIDGMETDIQLSRDEVPVLWHDRFMGKLGYAEKHIDDFDYIELQQMNFARHFSASATAEGIVSLHEYLQAYRKRTRLLLEIKNREWEAPARQQLKVRLTLAMVGQMTNETILVSSFHLPSLLYAQQIQPGFPLVYNFEEEQTIAEARQILTAHAFLHGLCLPISSLNQPMVELLRGEGKSIAVYTCNTDEEMMRALDLGVDILISDLPQKALQIRDQNK